MISLLAIRAAQIACLCLLPSHALYTADAINAYRVDDNEDEDEEIVSVQERS